jgi:hypothetical protein
MQSADVIMAPDILLVREGGGYRILHGHLRLANALNTCDEILVETKGQGKIKVIKTASGLIAGQNNLYFPILKN